MLASGTFEQLEDSAERGPVAAIGARCLRFGSATERPGGHAVWLCAAPADSARRPARTTARWTSFWRVTFRRLERSPLGAGLASWLPVANRIAQSVALCMSRQASGVGSGLHMFRVGTALALPLPNRSAQNFGLEEGSPFDESSLVSAEQRQHWTVVRYEEL